MFEYEMYEYVILRERIREFSDSNRYLPATLNPIELAFFALG